MKFLKQGLSLALLGAGLAAVPGLQASAAGIAPQVAGDSLVQRMKSEAQGAVALSSERATGKIGFIRSRGGDLMPSVAGNSLTGAADKAEAYLDKYASAFGTTASQLTRSGIEAGKYGWTVSFAQTYRGLPVFGSELNANLDRAGDLTAVNGYVAPGLDLSVTPRVTKAKAAANAIGTVRANPGGDGKTNVSGLKAKTNDLVVYRTGAIRGIDGEAVLAYVIEVTNERNIRDMVFVDAQTGKLLNRYSLVHSGLEREVYEASVNNQGTPDDPDDDTVARDLVWEEGDPLPGKLDQDQLNLVHGTGESYWFFRNSFGRDSYDGQGATMRTVNNDPTINCPNANWNGVTTNYCSGVTADDTVAHEWGHAYTEYTSGLIYQWQSGAMNESYSDIWGEVVDMINTRENETPDTKRRVGDCSAYTSAIPLLTINTPSRIAKECATGGLLGTLDAPVTGNVVAPADAAEEGGTTTDGCSPYNSSVTGQIVLVDRGLCTFVRKAEVARDAGAKAVIIGNREEAPVSFGSPDQTLPTTVSIGLSDRELIRSALASNEPVTVTIEDQGGARTDSYRWLSGEADPAFGGAIRDMWNPTCLGDPGKVSDAEYKCSTDDAGGVHSNSGVPNHAFALLVDGGTDNGEVVAGLGLTKASNLFWRTQTAYLTPTSDFTDLADGLTASCMDLTGQGLNELSTQPMDQEESSTEVINAGDCLTVAAAIRAVELNKEPTQCNFQPLLAKNAPATCGKGTQSKLVWKDDFENGLAKWKKTGTTVFDGGFDAPWKDTTEVPGNHDTRVAFAPAPDAGNCSGGQDDFSSSNAITSPRITMPNGIAKRLEFQHYLATEAGYDGGNVKIKVNGGGFEVVPADAYVFNAPNTTIFTASEGNTNPLAGQPGFSGTDGGVVNGSWGKSIINLNKVGAKTGDRVKIRFDLGRDGCGGIDGWYVDDVKVKVCKKQRDNDRSTSPKASAGRTTAQR